MNKDKKGFTLIELLAVIIILGVLLLIAIPSVTEYISTSRKKTYIATADKYIGAVVNKVNALDYNFAETDTMYYVPVSLIELEKGGKSPYGEWTEAYVVVTFDGQSYKYYWTSVDDSGMGMDLTLSKELDTDKINGGMTTVNKGMVKVEGKRFYVEVNSDNSLSIKRKIKNPDGTEPESYIVTFDCNGAECTVSPREKEVDKGSTYGELPTPVRGEYPFEGWYTEPTEGSMVESTTIVTITSNQTLYAHWGKIPEKLADVAAIGDYVNYNAGTWTETKAIPTSSTPFTFGGYTSGSSRNSSVPCDNGYGTPANSGWRVLSKNTATGEVKLIHAGQPECYYHPNVADSRGNSEKILSGNTSYNINSGYPSDPRDWSMYVNSTYATSATVFTKSMLDSWNGSTVSYGTTITNNLIKTSAFYYLGYVNSGFSNYLDYISHDGYVNYRNGNGFGVRPVITLKLNIMTPGQVSGVWQLQ